MQSGEWITINGQDYRLDAVLSSGSGSYGQVWAAVDAAGLPVAIKFINAEAMNQADPALHGHWRAHLQREITFLTGLSAEQSRHVVTLLNHGKIDEQPVLVLELLQGNLRQWLMQQRRENAPPPDLAQILDWAEQILDGLDVVHQAGFIYRDLKFSNLLVGDDGARLKLADFGSLKREDGDNTRSFIGTPATMAPEQALPARSGKDGCEYAVDYRADYYALGLLLFVLLTRRSTTAAQRQLGQLLALHGQEGAGQQGARLGGLNDDERELLRRLVEFWTVPARPEQGGGAAARLVELIERLLAHDPTDRPAHSLEIRAVLDAVRVSQPTASPLATQPLNRHWRRASRATPAIPKAQRRWALLAGGLALASALSWALLHPLLGNGPRPVEPTSAYTVPPSGEITDAPTPPAAAPAAGAEIAAAPESPASPPTATAAAPETSLTAPAIAAGPEAPPVDPAATAETPAAAPAAEVETPAATPAAEAEIAAESESPASPPTAAAAAPEAPVTRVMPVAATPAPVRTSPKMGLQPTETRRAVKATPKATRVTKPQVVATPRPPSKPVVEASPTIRPQPATVSAKPAKPVAAVERPVAVVRPSVVRPPVDVPRIAKPTPKPLAPPVSTPPVRTPVVTQTAPLPRNTTASKPAARPPAVVSRPPVMPKPVSKPAAQTARATLAKPATASRPQPPIALPPIKLESRSETALVLPPIKLESRSRATPPVPPPIELVSRPSTVATAASRPNFTPAMTPVQPKAKAPSPPAVRVKDPITGLRDEAGRAAAALGDLVNRTSATVSLEVRQGLKTAERTVGQWTGRCDRADGCGRNTVQVERRDRWVSRPATALTQGESRGRQDADEGFVKPPPR